MLVPFISNAEMAQMSSLTILARRANEQRGEGGSHPAAKAA